MSQPVRETPIPDPLLGVPNSPAHPDVPEEPVLNAGNIQGNIIGGFNKDFQLFEFLRITNAKDFKASLNDLIPLIATSAEVVAFNRLFKSMRSRLDHDPATLKVTWVNIALTFEGLRGIQAASSEPFDLDFDDEAFTRGLTASSPDLGDPTDPEAEGNPAQWRFRDGPVKDPNPDRVAHLVIIIAGDDPGDVQRLATQIVPRNGSEALLRGVELVDEEVGQNLPHDPDPGQDLAGHEHFGFLDGVSQPGIRGRLSENPHDVLTVRQNPNNREQGKPGQELIWPGAFVFGYPGQEGNADHDPQKTFRLAGPVSTAGPEWANDGALLVFRRLRQDVAEFHRFLQDTAAALGTPDPGGTGGSTAIENQFEFIIKAWVNNPDFKEDRGDNGPANVPQPENQGGGHDPILGQNNRNGENRRRDFTLTWQDASGNVQTRRVTSNVDWVIPTGGGYFFAPSLAALEMLANC